MMPRRSDPNDISKGAPAPTSNPPLRTYSRRSLKRRHTSPPAQPVERLLTRTGSLNVTEQKTAALKTAEQRSRAKTQPFSRHGPNRTRKSVEFPASASKTLNDLARKKALAASEPVSTRQDEDSQEGRSDEAHVVKCSPGQKRPEHQQPAVTNALKSPIMNHGGIISGNATSKVESPRHESLEGSDGFEDGSSEFVQDTVPDDTALTSSSEAEGITIPGTSSGQKPKNNGRFLVFDRSPPEGFKVLHKRANLDADESGIKTKRLADGFTKQDEARSTFLRKRRRFQHLDINIGSLDMTQTSIASQQRPKHTIPGPKMRPQTRTAAGLRRRPQYFGTSQFVLEPQDSIESPEGIITPMKRRQKELDRFGPIVIPRTDSPRPKSTIKMESTSGFPDEIVHDSSPSMRLLPKRSMMEENGKMDSLALRPGLPCQSKSKFVVTDTPLLHAATEP